MTNEEIQEQNARDLAAIAHLKKDHAFNNYFLRRLRGERDAVQRMILTDDKVTPEKREQLRCVWKEQERILGLLASDEGIMGRPGNTPAP